MLDPHRRRPRKIKTSIRRPFPRRGVPRRGLFRPRKRIESDSAGFAPQASESASRATPVPINTTLAAATFPSTIRSFRPSPRTRAADEFHRRPPPSVSRRHSNSPLHASSPVPLTLELVHRNPAKPSRAIWTQVQAPTELSPEHQFESAAVHRREPSSGHFPTPPNPR